MADSGFFSKKCLKCSQKWAYLKNGLGYSLVAWRGCYYQQSPSIATFTYAKGRKEKEIFQHFQEYSTSYYIIGRSWLRDVNGEYFKIFELVPYSSSWGQDGDFDIFGVFIGALVQILQIFSCWRCAPPFQTETA